MIVITGGAGFIGSAIIWGLNQRGIDDIIVVDSLKQTDKYKNLVKRKFFDYIDKEKFIEGIENGNFDSRIDGIIHMGACSDTTEKNASYLIENNYEYTKRLAQWSIKKGKRFVYASSGATYGDGRNGFSDKHSFLEKLKPLNMYGYSKHLFDLWALKNGYLDTIAGLKFFNVYGPNEYHKGEMRSMVHKAFCQVVSAGKIELFKSTDKNFNDGEQKRDFVYVKDVVQITLFIYEHFELNGVINVGTGVARSFNDLAKAVFKAMDKKEHIEYVDMPEYLKKQYQNFTQAEVSKLKDKGYDKGMYSLEEGISDYIKNYLLKTDEYL